MVMSKFKTIALYSSKDDHKVSIIGSQLVEIFSNMGIRVLIAKSSTAIDSRIKRTYSERYIVEKADLLISIGGDGTLLSAARIFGARGLPLMGINVGNIGFLTDISPDAMGLSLVLATFISKSLSIMSLNIQPALLIKTDPKKKSNK